MQIGIDARMYGPNVGGGGLGRYVEQFVKELPSVDQKNRYVLFVKENGGWKNKVFAPTIETKQIDIHWYTLKEQLLLAPMMDKAHLDLIHFPHWNVPVGIKTPFVVTIHDLILLSQPHSARATTRNQLVYHLKYQGFKYVLSHAVRASKKIITVSEATKADILKHFPDVSAEKICVIYEGITSLPRPTEPPSPWTKAPYLLYVGNAYPHKNLETLLAAFQLLHEKFPDLHLFFAGRADVFSERLQEKIEKMTEHAFIHFVPDPTDERLTELYAKALVYVFPSLIEGFGLPPLEAMSQSVPVAASDIPCLREILGEAAAFFPPNDPEQIAKTIAELVEDKSKREALIFAGKQRIKAYSWKTMTKEIVSVYEQCAQK